MHLLGDVINSVGVIIAALIITLTDGRMWYFDPICTYIFGIIVFITTRIVFTDCINMLMENTPKDMDTKELLKALQFVAGV